MNTNKKALVVDDSIFMRKNLIKILKKLGFNEFFESKDGIQAIKEFEKQEEIHLITLDITMMGMDGITALEKMNEVNNKLAKKMNVLMVTALGKQELITKALELGAKGYITKPFKEDQIAEQIKKLN
ncbi:Chemotaxis protein CheY [Borrelia miyamotoi]|uniref:Response regulator n=2 Tax=Borrelia miyamotoi TaxID=47466 RepID=A0AAP8YRN3_9SPIR|nr:response regulator [Borrelia miyamotoi]AHH04859.1 Chemotaxis protein cheY [Borrelia miyamotoi FR64b]AHH05598.1 Chemotaxis protein cheY [Borrelia miyamotoi FR64b]ATQ14683.1 response regulator [Borrelia miyamotoi]ATQ15867.1 response regulator [Borrelia miyamotoi]ATQ17011.1 response regulator [Borrelia miyamotoi]